MAYSWETPIGRPVYGGGVIPVPKGTYVATTQLSAETHTQHWPGATSASATVPMDWCGVAKVEPSGICWHPTRRQWMWITDGYYNANPALQEAARLYVCDEDGTNVRWTFIVGPAGTWRSWIDTEGICIVESRPTFVYIGREQVPSIDEYSLTSFDLVSVAHNPADAYNSTTVLEYTRRFDLTGIITVAAGQGLEGITFVPNASIPTEYRSNEEGYFFICEQQTSIVAIAELSLSAGTTVTEKSAAPWSSAWAAVMESETEMGDLVFDSYNNILWHIEDYQYGRMIGTDIFRTTMLADIQLPVVSWTDSTASKWYNCEGIAFGEGRIAMAIDNIDDASSGGKVLIMDFPVGPITTTFTAGTGGMVEVGRVEYSSHTEQTDYLGTCPVATAIPDPGYSFVNWTYGDLIYSDTKSIIVSGCTSPSEYVANFETYYNVPPSKPESPNPADGEKGVSTGITKLDWSDCVGAAWYRVAISTSPTLTDWRNFYTSEAQLSLLKISIQSDTRYYWRVRAISGEGEFTLSDIWSFTTQSDRNSGPIVAIMAAAMRRRAR